MTATSPMTVTTMTDHEPFTVHVASPSDIPRLSKIHVDSCLQDMCFRLYFPTAAAFSSAVSNMLEKQIGQEKWTHIKVIDEETAKIAAWASWVIPTDDEIRERDSKTAAENMQDQSGFDHPQGLATYVSQQHQKFVDSWTRGRRYTRCQALFVDPEFQRQGIGSSMVEYGNQLADKAGLPILDSTTSRGYPILKKAGFMNVGHVNIDLKEWAEGGKAKGGDRGYGNYRLYDMVRLPVTVASDISPVSSRS